VLTAVALGLLLGVRHAADPDHLVAVSAISAGGGRAGHSAWVGLVWGLGVPLRWAVARPNGAGTLAWVSGAVAVAFGAWMVWRVGSGGLL
jgi:hypothetical protein